MSAESVGQIGLDLVLNQKQFTQQLNGIQKMAKKVGATLVAAFSIKKLVEFSSECLELGSNLAEVQNVVDVTFPQMSKQVNNFAKEAAAGFGLSETMAKKFTGTFGAMSKAFGFSEKQAYDMSTTLTGLAGDVASFYNVSQDEAYTKLKSVFTGETESLKDLGVVMTQSALDAYALANGFDKTTKSMSEAEKVALRYGFVQKQLALAQGDFARTSDSWANQVRLLKLQFDSLKASIGQGLINVLTPVIKWLNALIGKLKQAADAFAAFTAALTGKKSSASSAGGIIDDLGGSLTDAGNAGTAAAKKILKAFAPIDEINVIPSQDKGSSSGGSVGGGGITIPDTGEITDNKVEESINKWTQALEKFKQQISPTTEALKNLWNEGLSKLGNFTWTALKDFYNQLLVPLGKWAFGTDGKGFTRLVDICNDLLKKINWDKLNKSLKEFWKAIEPYAEQFGEGLIDFFEDVGKFAVDVINKFPGLLDAITKALNNGDPEKARSWGYGLGVIATSLMAFKVGNKILNVYKDLKKLFGLDIATAVLKTEGLSKALDSLSTIGKITIVIAVAKIGFEAGKEIGKTLFPDDSEFYDKFKWLGDGGFFDTLTADAKTSFDGMLNMITDFKNNPIISTLSTIVAGPLLAGFAWIKKGTSGFENDLDGTKTCFDTFKTSISEKWEGMKTWFCENIAPWFTKEKWGELFQNIQNGANEKWSEFVAWWNSSTIGKWISENVAPWFTQEKWSSLWQNISTAASDMWNRFVEWWNSSALVVWFDEYVAPWLTREKWAELWQNVKQAIVDKCTEIKTDLITKWESIKTSVIGFVEGIKEKALEKFNLLKDNVLKIWNNVKDGLSGILEGIKTKFRTIFDSLVGIVKNPINNVIGMLNTLIGKMNGISFTIPSWVKDYGGKSFGLNIPPITPLAQGGYVKANTPRLAMIGDNTKYGEIVTPENKMFEVMTEALNNFFERFTSMTPQQQSVVEGGDITIPIYLGGQLIDEYIVTAQQRKNLRTGGR